MRRLPIALCALGVCAVAWLALPPRGLTWLELTESGSGRRIYAGCLHDGEEIVLTWRNSLFNLTVTEGFVARDGRLDLTRVTFADPRGLPPPRVTPEDLDDLYHTGGPFHVEGLARPFTRVVFRIGVVGDPRLTVRTRMIAFKLEVGFGGAVQMEARKPRLSPGGCLRERAAYLLGLFACGLD